MVQTVTVGETAFHVTASPREGRWTAVARRATTGDQYGIEATGATEDEAIAAMVRWLEWQREHEDALRELQDAQRNYHRTIAGSAFASAVEGPSPIELQKESLDRVEAARVRLEDIRVRRPPS
jgi:hypothetical protein